MSGLKRYRLFLITAFVLVILLVADRTTGLEALNVTGYSLREMAGILPPIFILLGLLDVWVPKEVIIRYMGEKSGIVGVTLAFIIGSAAAGPLYAAFPVASVLMKKGVKFSNVMIFIGAWSTTKVPMFLFELSSLGPAFALTRLLVDIPGIILIAHLLSRLISPEEQERIYAMQTRM